MKKRITLLFIAFCALLLPWQGSAQLWDINNCLPTSTLGTNVYGPMNSTTNQSAASRTAVVYQSSMLTGIAGQELTSIYFNKVTTGDMTGTPNLKIYLKETTDSDFGSGSLAWNDAILGATLVYDSNPVSESAGPSGWKEFAFSTPYTYSGTQNLVLITEYVNTGNTVNTTWLYEYTSPCINTSNNNTTKYTNNTTGTPGDPLGSSNYRRPIIGFDFTVDCPWVTNLTLSNVTSTGATFSWTPGGTETNWDYAVQPPGTGIPTTYQTTSSNPLNLTLTPQTHYEFYVRANCGGSDGESLWTGPYDFQTHCTSQLSGTYTIGGPTGDFATLTDAVASLNDCGVSGPVTFNVAVGSGPYNERLTITEFMGASATNTVTFNGNGETLTSVTDGDNRSLFLLDGADYVTITDFNLVTISDTNNFVVQLTNNADFNTISDNTVEMSSTITSTSTTNAGIVVSGSLTSATATTGSSGTNNTITGNTIIGGYYGININGQSATPSLDNIVSNNTLKDFYGYGISLRYNNNAVVADNDISRPDRNTVTTFYGIYLASGGEGNAIENNRIHTPFGGITAASTSANYGIYHTANDSPIGNESRVVNNIVHLTGNNGTIYALYNSNSDGVHYYHNTVVLDDVNATAGTTRGFYQTGTADNIEVKNNIFSIMREGSGVKYCLYFGTSASVIVSDNNVLHMVSTSGTTGIGYSGSSQATLADWQTATSGDMNSVDVNPLFVNRLGGDFMPSNAAVNNIGAPVGVATDFDGNLRNTTTPDPGVYEFTPPSCPPPSTLYVDNITATSADLGWNENGTATTWDIEWGLEGFTPTEIPNASATTNPHTLNGLTALTSYDFYVRAYCSPGDESTWVGPFTFITGCSGPLAGNYTVGATGDFETLSDVAYALNTCGISAATTFNVLPGSGPFEEQITLGEITGASATNTVVINGNGETITSTTVSANRSLILLDGTDYTTIVNFNLVTISDTNNFVIQLTNNADYNTITNNTIDMSSTMDNTGTTNAGIVVSGSLTSATATTGSSGTDNIIVGNTIMGGYYGIVINGQSATRSMNNIVSNNTLLDFYSTGIRMPYNNNSVVSDNEISRPNREDVTTFYGIYFLSGGEGHIVANNRIHTPFGGITSSLTSTSYGIYHSAIDSPVGNESKVINNIVHLSGNSGTIYALYNSSSDGVHYYHNTVVLDDDTSTGGITRGFYQTTAASNIELKNNVFSISRTGTGAKYCLYFNTAASSIISDHNLLYMGSTDGTTGIGYSGSAQTTLTDWQTATSGDMNSVDTDPIFANPFGGDFSPTNPAVDNIGTPVGVTNDINGNARSATTPDAGAYEFTPPSCPQPSALEATNITFNSAGITWQENGAALEWAVEYGPSGFTQGTGTVVADNDGTLGVDLTLLTSNTSYDVYVKAICGPGDESAWSGPLTFTTECSPFAAPYTMDFETSMSNVPDCWSNTGWEFDTTPSPSNSYIGSSGYFAFVDASSPFRPEVTLTTPLVDMSGVTSPKFEFYKYHYDNNSSATSVSNTLTVEIFDGTAWNIVHFDDNGDVNAWEKVEIDLTTLTITGLIQARFIVDATVGSNFYNDIGIDDVSFTGITPCVGVDPPVGAEYQAFLGSETLADLDVTGTNLTWYADAAGVNMLPDTTPLADGETYYVSQSVSGCESEFLAVTTIKGYVYLDNNWLPSNPSGISTSSDNIYVIDGLTTINLPLEVKDIHVMSGATLRIENILTLHGDMTIDGDLVFGSSFSGNGELAGVPTTSTITGEVTVEHYMQDRRSYRMVASSVTTTTSIHDNWQEGAMSRSDNPNPGYGTHITGSTIDQFNGFDATDTGNASMFEVDIPNQSFVAIDNTDATTLVAGHPYLLYVRGDRTLTNITTPDGHTATTLRARGQLFTGERTETYPTSASGQFVMFGNPYQSAIDVEALFANAGSNNVNDNHYWAYDVTLGDYGNYVLVDFQSGTNPSGSVANKYLQAGQAAQFATLSNGSADLQFTESIKAPGNYTANNAGGNGLMAGDMLNIQLYTAKNFNEGGSVHDGMALLFNEQFSNSITATDAPKAFGFGENLAVNNGGSYLTIERREMPVAGEVYSLYTSGYNHQEYVLKLNLDGLADVMMYLDDNYTGTSTLLNAGINTYSFEVGDELSRANDRFSIRVESLLNVNDYTFSGVRLYPNPLNAETFYIHAPMLNGKEVAIHIADMSGRQIYNRTLSCTSDRIEVSVNDTLSSGVYLVTIKHAGEFKTYRLIRE